MEKLNWKQILSISLMLFAIFFGAGNMIFPPAMGQVAGENYIPALFGFILTDAGIAILGIMAIVLTGDNMADLGGVVSKKLATLLPIVVYLLIGPLFALPRTGSVAFEISFLPHIDKDWSMIFSLFFTASFFLLTYWLSRSSNKIVDIVGKVLTPVLLISISCIFIGAISKGNSFTHIQAAKDAYQNLAFSQGMIEGYNALDGPAGLAFAIIVIKAIKAYGIKQRKNIVKYTLISGICAAVFLSIVYFMLTYLGAISTQIFTNGGALLYAMTYEIFGMYGSVVLGIAVLFACLTTSIGLTTSFADYFHEKYPKYSYKGIAMGVCFFSFIISNIGLTQLIQISLPILSIVYPCSVVLIILSFAKNVIKQRHMVYYFALGLTLFISLCSALQQANIEIPYISNSVLRLPFAAFNIQWLIPAMIGGCIGYLPFWYKQKQGSKITNKGHKKD